MTKAIYNYKNFIVLDLGDELLVKNCKGKYKNHSHFNRRTDIRSQYMFKAVMRLTIDNKHLENLERLYRKKFIDREYYININKGVVKR